MSVLLAAGLVILIICLATRSPETDGQEKPSPDPTKVTKLNKVAKVVSVQSSSDASEETLERESDTTALCYHRARIHHFQHLSIVPSCVKYNVIWRHGTVYHVIWRHGTVYLLYYQLFPIHLFPSA